MLYLEELYFFRLLPWKLLIFDLGILCSRLTLNFWAPSLGSRVCTAKNTHLDCVRTSLYPLQIAHKAGQPITKPVLKGQHYFGIICHALSCTSIWGVSRMVGVPSWVSAIVSSSSLIFAPQSHHKRLLPAFARFPTIQLYFRRKCGAEYASGVSGACYPCNQSYRRCIYSMCCVLYTCVGTHMLCRPRDYAGAPKMCGHGILRALKNKSSGGRSLAGVRDDMTRWCGACWSLLLLWKESHWSIVNDWADET